MYKVKLTRQRSSYTVNGKRYVQGDVFMVDDVQPFMIVLAYPLPPVPIATAPEPEVEAAAADVPVQVKKKTRRKKTVDVEV